MLRGSENGIHDQPADELQRLAQVYTERQQGAAGQDPYSLFFPGNLFISQKRQQQVLRVLKKEGFYPLSRQRILEVGCGDGRVLREFLSFGADPAKLHGVDLLFWRCQEAKRLNPNLPLVHADGRFLPYASASFDLVLQFTVFTSILDGGFKRRFAKEMLRVVKPTGMILWYDFWLNPKNPHTKGISHNELRELFPGSRIWCKRITLAPPIVRLLAPISWIACELLQALQLFNSHYVATIRPVMLELSEGESRASGPKAFRFPEWSEQRNEIYLHGI